MYQRVVSCLLLLSLICTASNQIVAGTFEVKDKNELYELMVRLRATQFLQRATFGPTDEEVDALTKRMLQVGVVRGAEAWIDRQFDLPATYHQPLAEEMVEADGFETTLTGINVSRYRYHAWWHIAITSEDQLRQRMAWALMQICVIGPNASNFNNAQAGKLGKGRWLGMSNYYDMLLRNSFKTYRDVLGDVTFHPNMGVWLSHLRNRKADSSANRFPDENYAREVLQLFSIGLYELNPDGSHKTDSEGNSIPTFDNTTIETFARLFTGLTYNQSNTITWGTVNFQEPMMIFEDEHDRDPKQVFNGVTLPGDTDGIADINAGLDNIMAHENIGPFICRRLIQRFVRSNPSKGYLERVVTKFNNNGQGVRGDLKAVIKAILLDQEAWAGIRMKPISKPLRLYVEGRGTEFSRLQEPVLAYASFLRRYAVSTDYQNDWYMFNSLNWHLNQYPYGSPSVFNFYLPDFQPAGEITSYVASENLPGDSLYAPEFQLLDGVYANRIPNLFRGNVNNGVFTQTLLWRDEGNITATTTFDYPDEIALAGDPQKLVEYLDAKLCCGTMDDKTRQRIVEAISISTNENNRYRAALSAVLNSPACNIAE
ncbi:MAG: DUF1800 family protein [Pirellulaceae bacterium]